MKQLLSVTLSEAKSLTIVGQLDAFGSEVLRYAQDDKLRK